MTMTLHRNAALRVLERTGPLNFTTVCRSLNERGRKSFCFWVNGCEA
jgi:hypothetical protein